MTYPDGMELMWDPITKRVTVIYEKTPVALLGPFVDRLEGIQAGEDHCRQLGWIPSDQGLE
jgi:hypothetical protein